MAKIDIKVFAASSEIVASIAVVISLLFVVYSINQNTAALQANNDNVLYEIQDEWLADVDTDGEFASIIVKYQADEELSEVEQIRYEFWIWRVLSLWELAFIRHRDGLLPPNQWDAWNISFENTLPSFLSGDEWREYRFGYGDAFVEHVDAVYSDP